MYIEFLQKITSNCFGSNTHIMFNLINLPIIVTKPAPIPNQNINIQIGTSLLLHCLVTMLINADNSGTAAHAMYPNNLSVGVKY